MKHISAREAARILQATESQVRSWSRMGALAPALEQDAPDDLTFQDLVLLRTTKGLLEAGVSPRRVRRIWSSLRRQLDADLPLSSIRVLADGDRAVAWDGNAMWQPDSGQFLLDFNADEVAEGTELDEHPAPRLQLRRAKPVATEAGEADGNPATVRPVKGARSDQRNELALAGDASSEGSPDESAGLTAEQWFHIGCELEDASPLEARHAYMQALDADPGYADAHLNLGRLDHEAGELGKAEAHYRAAAQGSLGDETCHFNLAVLLEDRGRPDEAILAYERAIACDSESADSHHNLGLLLDSRGRRTDAMRHLMIARRLYALRGRG